MDGDAAEVPQVLEAKDVAAAEIADQLERLGHFLGQMDSKPLLTAGPVDPNLEALIRCWSNLSPELQLAILRVAGLIGMRDDEPMS